MYCMPEISNNITLPHSATLLRLLNTNYRYYTARAKYELAALVQIVKAYAPDRHVFPFI